MRGHRLLTAFTFGAASLFVAEVIAAGVLVWPPTTAVAGNPVPAVRVPPPAQARPEPAKAPPSAIPLPSTSDTPVVPVAPAAQRPGTLRLPRGGTAALVREEIGPHGELPVPQSLGEATWWGARLDAVAGASVFAGHVNFGGRTGPFAELWTARIGDPVTVADPAGKISTYRISQVITLHKDELPQRADELFAQDGAHRIVLVTCGGRWLGGETGYAENRVVVADPA